MTGPHKDQPLRLLGKAVDMLRGAGYYSADEQAEVLCQLALLLAGMGGVMWLQQDRRERQEEKPSE